MEEQLQLDGIQIRLLRQKRRTVSLVVSGGEVIARAPLTMPTATVLGFARERLGWMYKQLAYAKRMEDAVRALNDLTEIQLGGKRYAARQMIQGRLSARAVRRIYADAFEKTVQRLDGLARMHGFRYAPPVGVTNAKTIWGCCSSSGVIRLNYRIVMLPERLSEYILLHELTHTVHHNHSKMFWAALQAVMPDCTARRKELKLYAYLMYAYR